MANLTDHNIDEPKNHPAAHRVWELVQKFLVAEAAWHGLIYAIANGYSKAWYRQQDVLDDIKTKIEADINREIFILSIFCAGIGGGLLGGIIGGALKDATEFTRDLWVAAGDDAASQFGGTAIGLF